MYRIIVCIAILFLTTEAVKSQNKNKERNTLIKLFSDLSSDDLSYKLSYLKGKKTFELEVSNKKVSKKYKFLEKDIHPEGVFFDENKKNYTLKILSIDNGHRFIFTKLRNGIRLSNTDNIIKIDNISTEKKENLKKFIYKLRNYRKSLIKKKPEDPKVLVTKPKN
jgi:hypothetical protein